MHIGIDFGTTNSAVAAAEPGRRAEVLPLAGPSGSTATWRTVLCFEPGERGSVVTAGAAAVSRWAECEGEARLVQSFKSYLASAAFSATTIFGRRWTLEDMIARYLRALRA